MLKLCSYKLYLPVFRDLNAAESLYEYLQFLMK